MSGRIVIVRSLTAETIKAARLTTIRARRRREIKSNARNRRLKCECHGWHFPHRVTSRSLSGHHPGCTQARPRW